MKLTTQIFAAFFLFTLPLLLNAQEQIEVTTAIVSLSKGELPAYIVEVPQADFKQVSNDWKKIIRQNTKSKVEEIDNEIIIKGTIIKNINQAPINIYSSVIHSDSTVKIVAAIEIDSTFFTLNDGNKTVQTEKADQHIRHFMRDFAVEQYKDCVAEELSNEKKTLKSKNKEYKNITNDIESYQKDIQENEQDILNSQDLISSYEADNERKLSQINAKKEANATITGEEQMKQAKSELKSMEKEKKSIESKMAKEKKNIVKYQTNIEEAQRHIADLKEVQEEKKAEIENQEDVVKAVDTRLAEIK